HSNRAEAHKHKVQCVNPHSLTSPSLPSMAYEHLCIEGEKGRGEIPTYPSGESTGRATRECMFFSCREAIKRPAATKNTLRGVNSSRSKTAALIRSGSRYSTSDE
ncbi:hypothetical protein KUCAC02_001551, partial [Chaenocephalus aceratus]